MTPSKTSRLLKRKPRTDTIRFCRDPNDAARLAALRKDAPEEVDGYLETVPLITFHLRGIGTKRVEELVAEHPPKPDQIVAHEQAQTDAGVQLPTPLEFDTVAFPPALIAESTERIEIGGDEGGTITGDKVTAEVIAEMLDDPGWSTADQVSLFLTAQGLNATSTAIPRELLGWVGAG